MAAVEDLLASFGEAMVGTPFELDAKGVCELGFHDRRRLTVEPEQGGDLVHLYSVIARLPTRNAETVYGKLLTANLFGKGTGDAWFAINPLEEAIVLNRTLATAHLDAEAFGEVLTGFMDTVEHWSRELDGHDFAEPEAEAEAETARPSVSPAGMPFIIRG